MDRGISHSFAASLTLSFFARHRWYTSWKFGGSGCGGLPKRTPRAFAAAIPSACRCGLLHRSSITGHHNCCYANYSRDRCLQDLEAQTQFQLVEKEGFSSFVGHRFSMDCMRKSERNKLMRKKDSLQGKCLHKRFFLSLTADGNPSTARRLTK